jgi:hypothetical protein
MSVAYEKDTFDRSTVSLRFKQTLAGLLCKQRTYQMKKHRALLRKPLLSQGLAL